jgi:SNF2 family DNA or RNA helicase
MNNLFEKEPALLMDDVGLGKTIQVLGFYAFVSWFREYHKKQGKYPGCFGE